MYNAVICTVAKGENIYINEWVNYHLKLGFDHIYLYDNNDSKTEYVGNFINNKDKVTIININDKKSNLLLTRTYTEFYWRYNKSFNWCLIIDIDEFLNLGPDFTNINDFLVQDKFNKFNQIRIKWQLFGDDDVIERDMSIPVHEFFKKPIYNKYWSNQTKCLTRGGSPEKLLVYCTHYAVNQYQKLWKACTPSGKELIPIKGSDNFSINETDYINETIFINHYMTKTLSEFLKYKNKRGDAGECGAPQTAKYFWHFNKQTPEKLAYLENYLKNE